MTWQVINGNNIDILKQYPDNHFDSIVTDPPYGIEFLGKDWDKNTGALETWQECLRVLKPGGYLLAFSAARTYHHLATNIESVGFEIRDQLMWIYSSGFPKSQDIGKSIDKRNGINPSEGKTVKCYDNQITAPEGEDRIIKGMCMLRCAVCNRELATFKDKQKPCERIDCPDPWTPNKNNEYYGWKTALKPAHEPIVMARKPFKGSCVDNVMEWGTGALNIDESRISTDEELNGGTISSASIKKEKDASAFYVKSPHEQWKQNEQGRYPSNVMGDIPEYQKYFYCPKVSRKERMEGNNHPTVKPVELMKYLIRLVTPKGGLVLDPFNGSGSTGMGAVELGMSYVGCELDPDYVEIAQKRIAAWEKKFDNPTNNLFDIEE